MILKKRILLQHVVCLGLSVLLVYLLGYPQRFDRILLTYFSLILFARFTIGKILFGIFFVIAALYFPAGFYYSSPNVTVVSTIAETNLDEFEAFCSQLLFYFYTIPLSLTLFFIVVFRNFHFPT